MQMEPGRSEERPRGLHSLQNCGGSFCLLHLPREPGEGMDPGVSRGAPWGGSGRMGFSCHPCEFGAQLETFECPAKGILQSCSLDVGVELWHWQCPLLVCPQGCTVGCLMQAGDARGSSAPSQLQECPGMCQDKPLSSSPATRTGPSSCVVSLGLICHRWILGETGEGGRTSRGSAEADQIQAPLGPRSPEGVGQSIPGWKAGFGAMGQGQLCLGRQPWWSWVQQGMARIPLAAPVLGGVTGILWSCPCKCGLPPSD